MAFLENMTHLVQLHGTKLRSKLFVRLDLQNVLDIFAACIWSIFEGFEFFRDGGSPVGDSLYCMRTICRRASLQSLDYRRSE